MMIRRLVSENKYIFRFEKLDMNVVAVPKTGCSSILNKLIMAEEFVEGFSPGTIFGPFQGQLQSPTMRVHGKAFVYRDRTNGNHDAFSIHGNPFDRIGSAFLDKVLLRRDRRYFERLNDKEFFGWIWASIEDIRHLFISFLSYLKDNSDFFNEDGHWSPQVNWIVPGRPNYRPMSPHYANQLIDQRLKEMGMQPKMFDHGKMNETPLYRSSPFDR